MAKVSVDPTTRSQAGRPLRRAVIATGWCAPVLLVLGLTTACGSSGSDVHLDQTLVKRVQAAFAQVEHADGSHTQVAISVDEGSGPQLRSCLTIVSEPKSVSPHGSRTELGYSGSGSDLDSAGRCLGGSDARAAFVDGKLVYVPSSVTTKRTKYCKATYQRETVSASASSQLGQYTNDSTSGKLPKLLKAAKKITEEQDDIVVDLDPNKAAAAIGSSGSPGGSATASMAVEFDARGTVSAIEVKAEAGDTSLSERVSYTGLGAVQHIALPTGKCLIPGIGTLNDASELTQALGIS